MLKLNPRFGQDGNIHKPAICKLRRYTIITKLRIHFILGKSLRELYTISLSIPTTYQVCSSSDKQENSQHPFLSIK